MGVLNAGQIEAEIARGAVIASETALRTAEQREHGGQDETSVGAEVHVVALRAAKMIHGVST